MGQQEGGSTTTTAATSATTINKLSFDSQRSSAVGGGIFSERDVSSAIGNFGPEDSTSPRNLKKLTATFKDKLNLNNNVGSASTFVNSTSSAQSASPTIIAQRTKKN